MDDRYDDFGNAEPSTANDAKNSKDVAPERTSAAIKPSAAEKERLMNFDQGDGMNKSKLVLRTRAEQRKSMREFRSRFDGSFVGPQVPSLFALSTLSTVEQERVFRLMSRIKTDMNELLALTKFRRPDAGSYEVFLGEPRNLRDIWHCFSSVKIVWETRIRSQAERLTEPYWSGRGVVVYQDTWFTPFDDVTVDNDLDYIKDYLNVGAIRKFMILLRDEFLKWEDANPKWNAGYDCRPFFFSFVAHVENALPLIVAAVRDYLQSEEDENRDRETYCTNYCGEYGITPMDDLDRSIYDDDGVHVSSSNSEGGQS